MKTSCVLWSCLSLIMLHPVMVILPVFPANNGEITYIRGNFTVSSNGKIQIYIIQYSTDQELIRKSDDEENSLYGCCGDSRRRRNSVTHFKNHLILDHNLNIIRLFLGGVNINRNRTDSCVMLLYDYKVLKNSDVIDSPEYLSDLSSLLHKKCQQCIDSDPASNETIIKTPYWLGSSTIAQYLLGYINVIIWLFTTTKKEGRVSIKARNLVLSMITDVILGYIFLELFVIPQHDLCYTLMDIMEKLVNLLYSLLKWLMGAPAGLKLNEAFNNMLGKYFAYHVQLWWLFLEVTRGILESMLHIYQYVGYLGFTFQAAIISDIIFMATFHSYCIYIYAARLFNIQIRGLSALLRLFVGRKYNPLRDSIDSCEYTNQELFVGTVAFTILLLLLPTTTLYYIVFTLLRVMSLAVQYILVKLIYLIQTLPLYVVTLWLAKSPKVAGKVFIEVQSSKELAPLVLRVKIFNKPLRELITKYKPPIEPLNYFQWNSLFSNVLVGKQLV